MSKKRPLSSGDTGVEKDSSSPSIQAGKVMKKPGVFSPPVRLPTDYALIKQDLQDLGLCVVGEILSPSEQTEFYSLFWTAVSKRRPALVESNQDSWIPDNYEWKGNYGAGQYKHYGMAQEDHCWHIRKNKTIRNIFEKGVYDNEECCVSLDGAAALFQSTVSTLELHVDLAPHLQGFEFGSVQGAYNLYEVIAEGLPTRGDAASHSSRNITNTTELCEFVQSLALPQPNKTARYSCGFVCVPGSHVLYQKLWDEEAARPKFKAPKLHRVVLGTESPLQNQAVLITSPANSLVLWRSELQHKNYGGDFSLAELGHMCRLTQFVAWQPKKYRSESVLAKKIKNVYDGCSGNHWAALSTRVSIKPFPPWGTHVVHTVLPFDETKRPIPEDILNIL